MRRCASQWQPEQAYEITPKEEDEHDTHPRRGRSRVAAIVAALAVVGRRHGAAQPREGGLPTAIGKGEGALNLIEWVGYSAAKSYAAPFEKQTGCKIHRKDAGSSNEMVALMRSAAAAAASGTSSPPRATPASASSTVATSSRSTSA